MLRSYCFIINPNAGSKRYSADLADCIKSMFGDAGARFAIHFTDSQGHGREIAARAVNEGFEAVVAAGGDGTINEVLAPLAGTGVALGIIPKGSGNGFARTLALPFNPRQACAVLLESRLVPVDIGKIGKDLFINVAGIGLDAAIGQSFDRFGKGGPRGKWPYFYLGLKEYMSFRPQKITLDCCGQTHLLEPLTLTFANGKQYGGGAKIAPAARIDDGMFHAAIVSHEKWYSLMSWLPALFSGDIESVPFIRYIVAKEAVVSSPEEILYHVDGEPRAANMPLRVEMLPSALRAIAGPSFRP